MFFYVYFPVFKAERASQSFVLAFGVIGNFCFTLIIFLA